MPPQGRERGGGNAGGRGAGRAGSAASAGSDGAGPSTSGRSGSATPQLSFLPPRLLEAYRALPAAAEALLPAPPTQRPGGDGSSAAGRGRGRGGRGVGNRVSALRDAKESLSSLRAELSTLPHYCPQPEPALAELLSTHLAETVALLGLFSAALRPGGSGSGSGSGGSPGSGSGGNPGGSRRPVEAWRPLEGWEGDAFESMKFLFNRCIRSSTASPTLPVLRLALALLRAQTLPALSRRLAAAATAAGSNSCGGGVPFLQSTLTLLVPLSIATIPALLRQAVSSQSVPSDEVTSLRATCAEEYARGLAESGLLEHAARLLLRLQERAGQAQATGRGPAQLLGAVGEMWSAVPYGVPPQGPDTSSPSPTAVAHLETALSGPCLHTAVLVYGISTLHLVDDGPSCGLATAALQKAGRALSPVAAGGLISADVLHLLNRILSYNKTLSPPGPIASLDLVLRMSQAGAAAAAATLPPSLALTVAAVAAPPPLPPTDLSLSPRDGPILAVIGLVSWRVQLTWRRVRSAPLAAMRQEWWRLAVSTAVYGLSYAEADTRHQLIKTAVDALLPVWPDGRLDLDALPPAVPVEVAAALAAGLLPALASLPVLHRSTAADGQGRPALARSEAAVKGQGGPFGELLSVWEGDPPGAPGFALFLAPLLAYGEPEQAEGLLAALGRGLEAGRAGGDGPGPLRRAATNFLGAAGEALQRCRALGPAVTAAVEPAAGLAAGAGAAGGSGRALPAAVEGAAGEGAAGEGSAGAAAAPPPQRPDAHLRQLGRLVAGAAEAWGLPLGTTAGEGPPGLVGGGAGGR